MDTVTADWVASRTGRSILPTIARYATFVFVPYFKATSVFGFSLLVNMITQMWSGIMLSLYYVPDPSFVMTFREEYTNEVWWFFYVYKLHVIGVDSIFVLSYAHLLKKIYVRNYVESDVDGWFTGAYAFLVYHVVVFLGITLSSNHLGDVTITIAANIYWSLVFRLHRAYAIFFSNKHLNVDQLTRFMVAHYVVAWYYTYLVQLHVMFIHEAWDADSNVSSQQDSTTPKQSWIWDALKKEALLMFALYAVVMSLFTALGHPDARVVNYNFFEQWSEAEMEEINFFIVAPHWYFRAHMGLLTVCAQHYEGLFWLVSFYVLLAMLPAFSRAFNPGKSGRPAGDPAPVRHSMAQTVAYVAFVASITYVAGTLPCGRFYYEGVEGFFGNVFLKASYQYIFGYLAVGAHLADRAERWASVLPSQLVGLDAVASTPEE